MREVCGPDVVEADPHVGSLRANLGSKLGLLKGLHSKGCEIITTFNLILCGVEREGVYSPLSPWFCD